MGKKVDPQVFFRVSNQQRALINVFVRKWNSQKGKATRSDVLRHIVLNYCEKHLTKKERERIKTEVEERSYYVRVNPYEEADRFWSRAREFASQNSFFRGPYERLLRTDEPVLVPESWLKLARGIRGFSAAPLLVNKDLPKRFEKYDFRFTLWVPDEIANIVRACAKRLHRSVSSLFRYALSYHLSQDGPFGFVTKIGNPLPSDGQTNLGAVVSSNDMTRWVQRARAQGLYPRRLLMFYVGENLLREHVLSDEEKQKLSGYVAYLAMRLNVRKRIKKTNAKPVIQRKTYAFSTR